MVNQTWTAGLVAVVVMVAGAEAFGHVDMDVEEINVYPEYVQSGDPPIEAKEKSDDVLSKDAVYVGSLTFAGLALFSSAILTRNTDIDPKNTKQVFGMTLLYISSIGLIGMHIAFPFMYESNGWEFQTITLLTLLGASGVWVGYVLTGSNTK